jgi:flagellar hook-associated protein 2
MDDPHMSTISSLTGTGIASGATIGQTSSSSPVTVSGLVSGINTNELITALLATDQQKVTSLQSQQTSVTTQQTAFDSIEAQVTSLQSTLAPLANSINGVFNALTATPSNTNVLNAAASSNAVAGVYNITVNQLATANEIASQGFDSPSSQISQGTLTLNIGTASNTITIDSTNDTLQGLADAINASGAAVTASIVSDGSGTGQQGYRLLLASTATGTANTINITNNLAATGGGATQPIFSTGTISNAIPSTSFSGTSTVQTNVGAGYTGTSNDDYTFTVTQGGTVGTDAIQLSYTDTSGQNTGTITVNPSDLNTPISVPNGQGMQVQFSAGTLNQGDSFSVKTFVPTVQAATNAAVTLGSGNGALTVSSSSNQINSLIPGVTLSLVSAAPDTPVSVTVGSDTASITTDINNFVTAYNSVINSIQQETGFDTTTNAAGPLLGNIQTQTMEDQIRVMVEGAVASANPLMNNLGALGITTGSNGQLSVDSTQLANVLSGSVAGVSIADVAKLFSLTGSSTNAGVQFVTGSNQTQSSGTTPYTLQVTQAAQQASLAASTALAASTVIDTSNNTLTVNVDGQTSDALTLASGTYTPSQLAQAVQSAINGDAALKGEAVNASVNGSGQLVLSSNVYGSGSQVTVESGTALSALGFDAGATAKGIDVAGNFVVNGVTEAATGSGQILSGNSGNANTAGLEVQVTLTPAQVGSGISAAVTVSNGIAAQLNNYLSTLTNPATGQFVQIDSGYQTQITGIQSDITAENTYIQQKTTQLQTQFAAMEETLAKLQQSSSIITQAAQSFAANLTSATSSSSSSSSSSGG